MDPARLAELAASIRASGIVQPILVRRRGERYQIIAGRAALAGRRRRPGLASVPVIGARGARRAAAGARARRERPARGALGRSRRRRPSSGSRKSSRLTPGARSRAGGPRPHHGREHAAAAESCRASCASCWRPGELDAGHARALLAPRARRGPARARSRGRAQGPLGARGRTARGAAARPARGRGAASQRPEHRGPPRSGCARALGTRVADRAARQGRRDPVLFTSEAELSGSTSSCCAAARSR